MEIHYVLAIVFSTFPIELKYKVVSWYRNSKVILSNATVQIILCLHRNMCGYYSLNVYYKYLYLSILMVSTLSSLCHIYNKYLGKSQKIINLIKGKIIFTLP